MLEVINLYYYCNTLLLKHYSLTLTHYKTKLKIKIKLYKYSILQKTWIFTQETDFTFERFKIVRYLMTLEL